MSSLPGSVLVARYRIERELGRGGMATVYLAEDLKLGRQVAVKVLRPELAAVLGAERFLAEIRTTAQLQHPNILTLHESGEAGELLFYVMPYVAGESLRARLTHEKQLGLEDALAITRQLAGALDYAHRQGVIHRDIKPENILLAEGQALLADFGIALAVKQAGGNRLTETGISLGTPEYMSPEQATGDRELDGRSDVYSLAAVLYEMLAGEPPHTGPTAQAVIAKLMTTEPTPLRVVRPTVPEAVEAAVIKGLAKVPADRWASAGEFARALSASPQGRARARPPLRLLLPLVLAGAVVLVALWYGATRPTPVRVIQPDQTQLTFTGNARTPALSTDGKRLAYSTRACDTTGTCTADVVVQDIGGAGSATVLRSWGSIWDLEWSGDDRYLMVNGSQGPGKPAGIFGVPVLGGEPRLLGNVANDLGTMVGNSDTVLAYQVIPADTIWLRWITIADAVTRDSLALPRRPGQSYEAWPFPDGQHILLIRNNATQPWTAIVIDRRGRSLDSLPSDGLFTNNIRLTRDGRVLLVQSWNRAAREEFDVLAYRIDGAGRIDPHPDTVLRQQRGEVKVAPNGMLLLASGPVHGEVWALSRDGSASMRFTQQRVASATSGVSGMISPDGDRILLERIGFKGERTTRQYSLVPFEGGPETPVDTPADAVVGLWTWNGTGVLSIRIDKDTARVIETDLATNRSRPFASLWIGMMGGAPHVLSGGGFAFNALPFGVRRWRVPGLPDTTFKSSESPFRFVLAPSPDGRAVSRLGLTPNNDSLALVRVSLLDGSATRLASFRAEGADQTYWLNDGTLLLQLKETNNAIVWYRMPASGGTPVRLGIPPRYPASYSASLDGRRIVASVREDSPDVYLIRNFVELWRH
jgi:eukaryotic-like serine/threonine-protein kinase